MLNSDIQTTSVIPVEIPAAAAQDPEARAMSPQPGWSRMSKLFSDSTLTKKAYLNAVASALDYASRLIVGFVINPLLVAGLGDQGYGAWQVLGRLISYISPASGRPSQALKWTIANRQASAKYDEKRRQIGSTVVVWLLVLPVLAGLGALVTWFAPTWLHSTRQLSGSIRAAAALLVADLIIVSLADVPRSVLQGENLGYKRMGLSTILVLAGGAMTAVALRLRTGLTGVALANLATTALTGALFLKVARIYAPWFGIAWPSMTDVRRFVGLSWWFLVWGLIRQLMMASDVVVLGTLGSVELVTAYTLTKYAPETVISSVAIVVFGITPGLGGIIGSGNLRKAIELREEIMVFTWLISAVAGATILLWNRAFLELWVGKKYDAGFLDTLLIMLMVIQFVLIRNDANIIDLTLELRSKVLLGTLSAGLSLAMGGVLVRVFHAGISGMCLGFIAGRAVLSLGYPYLVGRHLNLPLVSQLKSALRPALVTALLFAAVPVVGRTVSAKSWLALIFAVGTTVILASLAAFRSGLSRRQRQSLWARFEAAISAAA